MAHFAPLRFSPVQGHEEPATDTSAERRCPQCAVSNPEQTIYDGVTGHLDGAAVVTLGNEVLDRPRGRCEMPRRELSDETPVGLFGKGVGSVMRSQPRFDVRHRYAFMECR